ncbi:4-amino-4-deoxy-L-arabinose-phosphoundecaprenol flippase subunit ArnE [Hafnia psychrotolerans]|jgi:undecaprenyl phosphate-alpha-L-ara4N flippase subunit ArnE|uniref:Probable 4-amino-4-deoxy-L-arabinose-phosphoundecaprenol flippase subunit ArnE n=1 Tax=Hafnia psychrotolerans TaxID=1477018 RepID=A0ABQ1GBN6_9GAMM|nr:4-amino-4-deoxy-L-arabinose-phosphoundecaprenol flippase subunit ArnE [Hafnia psychrotolerans]GGA40570.1 putative 4-amino-4-deoxy-L-arabinose-phosphoundecaprenol flippase subunit ArnE [Hafnia psychrotolerans]
MIGYLLVLVVSVLTCAGQLCQKQAAQIGKGNVGSVLRWLALAVCLLGLAMLLWLRVLQQLPLSIAYPMLSLNFVLITLSARWIFKEQIDRRHWVGVGFIMLGIALMSVTA